MTATNLPKGRIRQMILRKARSNAIWAFPSWALIWSFIFLIPWESIVEENGAAPLALNAWRKLMAYGEAPLPWMSVGLTVLMVLVATAILLDGLTTLSNPGSHPMIKALKAGGHDPVQAVSAFQKGMKRRDHVDIGAVSATPEWVLALGDSPRLIPLRDIAWAYFKSDTSGDVVVGVFRMAGLVSARQAKLARDDKEVLVLHLTTEAEPLEIESSSYFGGELADFLVQHNDQVVFGWDKKLDWMWKNKPESFAESAKAHITNLTAGQTSQDQPRRSGDWSGSDIADLGGSMIDRLGDD